CSPEYPSVANLHPKRTRWLGAWCIENAPSVSGSSQLHQYDQPSSLKPSSEPFVSTNTWSRYGAPQTSAADYARTDKHAGNIFKNFYAVGYQRHRRLITAGTSHHRASKFNARKPTPSRSPATREPCSSVCDCGIFI
ncbi:hypothetical protein U1Q18_051882, partial [Sarracenia purpurea var. burkii]